MKVKILLLSLLFTSSTLFAQSQYKVYSALMYHVMKNTQWPAGKTSSSITVGVIGSSTMITNLKGLAATKTINGKKIIVKKIGSVSDATSCNVVFLAQPKNDMLTSLSTSAKSNALLLVTESPGSASKGAVINFSIAGGKPIIELNEKQANSYNIKITSDLKKLAKLVN